MKVLEIGVDFDGGGIDRYLYNNCTRIKDVEFEFVIIQRSYIGVLEEEMIQRGYRLYKIPSLHSGVIKHLKALRKIFKNNTYDIVHFHLGYKGLLDIVLACFCGVKVRVAHSHLAYIPMSKKQNLIKKICSSITIKLSSSLAACGYDAAIWMWGENNINRVEILNNAIPTDKYAFSDEIRSRLREELGLKGIFVVGHVGRLSEQKNQIRLLSIFKEIIKNRPNSKLLLVGDGEMEEDIKNQINKLRLNESVLLLGVRSDVPDLLNVFDVFVFPSVYEGLPFTLIEAQCNGLPILSSDAVTKHVLVSNCLEFMPLSASNEEWAQKALLMDKGHNIDAVKDVIEAGYDIDKEANHLRNYYKKCISKL